MKQNYPAGFPAKRAEGQALCATSPTGCIPPEGHPLYGRKTSTEVFRLMCRGQITALPPCLFYTIHAGPVKPMPPALYAGIAYTKGYRLYAGGGHSHCFHVETFSHCGVAHNPCALSWCFKPDRGPPLFSRGNYLPSIFFAASSALIFPLSTSSSIFLALAGTWSPEPHPHLEAHQ